MALTEAQTKEKLSALGIPADKLAEAVKWVMDGHIASINALREERDGFKADAEKYKADAAQLPKVQKELDDYKAKAEDADNIRHQYETERDSFKAYKKQIEDEKTFTKQTDTYRSILKEIKVGERQIDNIIEVSGTVIRGITFDKDGKPEKVDDLKKNAQEKWSGFIMNEAQHGADVDNPPANDGTGGSKPQSRAAQIAAEYHKNRYGEAKGE